MARRQFTAVRDATSDETFREFGSAFNSAFLAVGLAQTSDTGQIDWPTFTRSTSVSVIHGYEIYRFDDPLQAQAPIYFKWEYGSTTGVDRLIVYLTVGSGSDGAGNITGTSVARLQISAFGTQVAETALTCLVSGDGSYFAFCPWVNSIRYDYKPVLIIDRSRDSYGAPTPDGYSVSTIAVSGSSSVGDTLSTSGTFGASGKPLLFGVNAAVSTSSESRTPVALPRTMGGQLVGSGAAFAAGTIGPVFPWTCYAPGVPPWQVSAALSFADDPGGIFTTRVFGQNIQYRSIPISGGAYNTWGLLVDRSTSISHYVGLAIRWEGPDV